MKKLFVLVFAIALCLGALCLGASAAEEHGEHSGWTELTAETTELKPGIYYLSDDVTYTGTGPITVTKDNNTTSDDTVTLCLNGHVMDLNGQCIKVDSGAALTLCDCTSGTTSGYLDSDGLWHPGSSTDEGTTPLELTGGVITGGEGYEENKGTYNITYGGGVVVSGGTFTMTGGSIAGNTAPGGGGVYVYDSGTFTMSGGSITGNTANSGGGVYVGSNGTFTMSGGSITGNIARSAGGGVGVLSGTFNMTDGTIAGNTATYYGGGVNAYSNESITMSGGTITGNTANEGGGVFMDFFLQISGDLLIQGNTAYATGNDLYVLTNWRKVTIFDELTSGTRIVVSMETPGTFTSGWNTHMQGKDPADYFFSDNAAYGVLLSNGEAILKTWDYTVAFDPNGGAGEVVNQGFFTDQTKSLTPNASTRTGYTFVGWNTAADGTGTTYKDGAEVSDLTTEPNGTVTLYAQWTANEYAVQFDPNDGEGEMTGQQFTYDTAQKLKANTFTRAGYTFAGWNTKEDGTGTPYEDREQVGNLTDEDDGTVTLYAQWTANTYTVTLHLNGGKFADGAQDVTSYTYGTTTLLPNAEQMIRSGYRFEGWYADVKFQNGPYTQISATDLGNKTFYARWSFINIPDPNGITVTQPSNGTVKVNPSNGSAGTLITVTATPDEGYELAYITVDGEKISGNTFRMPDTAVTVTAVFVPESFPFVDVKSGDWFYDYVAYVYANGLMDGTSATTFEPNATLTRAMVWTIIARTEGVDTDGGATWYAKAQEWVTAMGISDGENPSAAITRQELVTMLWRLSGEPVVNYALTAPDADVISSWALEAMRWAVSEGIVEGDETGLIHPTATCTRAEAAAILMRLG